MVALKHLGIALLAASAAIALMEPACATTRVQKTFGGWSVDCAEQDSGSKACSLQYALVTQKDKRPVFSWTIIGGKDGEPSKVLLRTPTGVLLTDGINIGLDGADPVKINYLTCGSQACIAQFDLTEQWLKTLGSYPKVLVSYKSISLKPIRHEIDLKKFGDAYNFYASQLREKK